jgi:hypothetical protein
MTEDGADANEPVREIGPGKPPALFGTRQPLQGEVVYNFSTSGQPPIALLDGLSLIMDRLFVFPGTRLRFGLNTILMLLPVLGDIIPTLVSVAILIIGLNHYSVPRIVAARMILNSFLDAALGWIPIVGDLFDLFFKADTRNVRLLQAYIGEETSKRRATWQHWVFVLGVLLLFGALFVLLVIGAIALVRWINHAMWGR